MPLKSCCCNHRFHWSMSIKQVLLPQMYGLHRRSYYGPVKCALDLTMFSVCVQLIQCIGNILARCSIPLRLFATLLKHCWALHASVLQARGAWTKCGLWQRVLLNLLQGTRCTPWLLLCITIALLDAAQSQWVMGKQVVAVRGICVTTADGVNFCFKAGCEAPPHLSSGKWNIFTV